MKNNSTTRNRRTRPSVAQLLSDLLHHPELPQPLYDGIVQAMDDMFNSHVDQDEINEFGVSLPYIEMLIRGYRPEMEEEHRRRMRGLDSQVVGGVQ